MTKKEKETTIETPVDILLAVIAKLEGIANRIWRHEGKVPESLDMEFVVAVDNVFVAAADCLGANDTAHPGTRRTLAAVLLLADARDRFQTIAHGFSNLKEWELLRDHGVAEACRQVFSAVAAFADEDQKPMAIESVADLLAQNLNPRQICMQFSTRAKSGELLGPLCHPNGTPNIQAIQQEQKEPGSVLKDWKDPRAVAQQERIADERRSLRRLAIAATCATQRLADVECREGALLAAEGDF
jgi:hypothetical protein